MQHQQSDWIERQKVKAHLDHFASITISAPVKKNALSYLQARTLIGVGDFILKQKRLFQRVTKSRLVMQAEVRLTNI